MIAGVSAFCLDVHAGYRCRHAGACCRADWAIPVEAHVVRTVERSNIRPPGIDGPLFVPNPDDDRANADPLLGRTLHGACVFFDPHANGSCSIQRHAGVQALPSACRHFPREILIDPRGTFISLSHFCPTAAALLGRGGSLDIVDARPPLLIDEPHEGMDATNVPAPLLRPGRLCDMDGYDAWERACLRVLSDPSRTAREALDAIDAATEDVREWRPHDGPLAARVQAAFSDPPARMHPPPAGFAAFCARHFPPEAGPIPGLDDVWHRLIGPTAGAFDPIVKQYLATRLFANWIAYQGRGLRTIVVWLRAVMAVFTNELARRAAASGAAPARHDVLEAIRRTDWLLLHTADSAAIARHFSPLEGPEPA
jgi:Fe-S-cluster containining protein